MGRDGSAPLVSVVVPTYDRPTHLERAVESVVDQTYEHVELIMVDDASPTPAVDVPTEMDVGCRFGYQCIRHERNRGGSAARNTGIEAARGDFIAFLDDDDKWVLRKLEAQVARAQREDSPAAVYTGVRNVDRNGRTNAVKTRTIEGDVAKQLLYRNFIGTFSAVMVDAKVVERIGGVDNDFRTGRTGISTFGSRVTVHSELFPNRSSSDTITSRSRSATTSTPSGTARILSLSKSTVRLSRDTVVCSNARFVAGSHSNLHRPHYSMSGTANCVRTRKRPLDGIRFSRRTTSTGCCR